MPPSIPRPTLATPKNRSAHYVVEIRDAAGVSLLLTRADWTDGERDLALLAVSQLVGMKAAAPLNAKETRLTAVKQRRARRHRRNRPSIDNSQQRTAA
jgi:hypothetical protein